MNLFIRRAANADHESQIHDIMSVSEKRDREWASASVCPGDGGADGGCGKGDRISLGKLRGYD